MIASLLLYSAADLCYRVLAPQLSDTDKHRVCLIQDIDKIQYFLTGTHISTEQFDQYMLTPIDILERYILDQSAILNRHQYDNRIQGADF